MTEQNSPDGTDVFIGLGSNIEARANLPRGLRALAERVRLVGVSRVYETDPVDAPGTPMYLNAAVRARTAMDPETLKHTLLQLEEQLGRVRVPGYKSAPREIDYDLLLYGDEVLRDGAGSVVVPHPDIAQHAYVALPLSDLAPEKTHPMLHKTLGELAAPFTGSPGVRPIELDLAL